MLIMKIGIRIKWILINCPTVVADEASWSIEAFHPIGSLQHKATRAKASFALVGHLVDAKIKSVAFCWQSTKLMFRTNKD